MNKLTFRKIIVSLFVMVSVFGLVGCGKKIVEPEPAADEIDRETQEVTEVDTSHWKTYRNENYKFEVKYPEDWVYEEKRYKNKKMPKSVYFGEKDCAEKYDDVTECDYKVLVSVYDDKRHLNDVLNSPHSECTEKIPLLDFSFESSEILSCRHFSALGSINDNYVFYNNDLGFVLLISRTDPKYDESIDPNYKPIIERKILESLKFIEN